MDQTEMRTRPDEETISLLDLLSVVVERRRFIIWSTVIAAVLIVIFSLYTLRVPADSPSNPMPNRYTPEVQVRLLESQSTSLSSQLQGTALGALAGLSGLSSATSMPTNADLAMALLKGRTLADEVTTHFDFVKRYHIKKDPRVTSGPSRGKISIVITLVTFFLAVFIAFVMRYFDRVKQDPVESMKLNEIKEMLGRPRRA